ncbi:MAG: hypothetical protein K8T91_19160 [Planctomycetes bacterium]|nr:hypothetical protein [Planctomycetota bacterium]
MNLHRHVHPKLQWTIVLVMGIAGCGHHPDPRLAGSQTTSARTGATVENEQRERNKALETPKGKIASEVYIRSLDANKRSPVTTRGPNDMQIRLLGMDELVVIPTGGYVAFAKPGTEEVAYLAFICKNSACQAHAKNGRPLIFPQPYKHIKLNSSGEIDWNPVEKSVFDGPGPADEGMPPCPVCHSSRNVEIYVFPEVLPRLQKLQAELKESRIALRKARSANTPFPSTLRPPIAIMQEMHALPQLFLTREVQPDGTNNVPDEPAK